MSCRHIVRECSTATRCTLSLAIPLKHLATGTETSEEVGSEVQYLTAKTCSQEF